MIEASASGRKHVNTTTVIENSPALLPAMASPEIVADTTYRLERLSKIGMGGESWWDLPRPEIFQRLHSVVGSTPIDSVLLDESGIVSIKLEYENPSGSHYDRAYLDTIEHFESIGYLKPGDELRDITSGSAGISLALIGHLLGYKVRISVPSELPANRIYPMVHYGAEVFDTGAGYVPESSQNQIREILEFRDNPEWEESRPADKSGRSFLFSNGKKRICYLNHSENELSPISFETIADELSEQTPNITHILLAEGNWTTINGIARRIRQVMPWVKIISYSGEVNNGTTENYGTNVPDVPIRFKDTSLVDAQAIVENEQRDAMQEVAPHLGRSSLMGLALAKTILSNEDASIVTIGYDEIKKY